MSGTSNLNEFIWPEVTVIEHWKSCKGVLVRVVVDVLVVPIPAMGIAHRM